MVYNFLIDPRTKDYFLVENPFYIFTIISLYIYFVTKLGPAMMRNRKPLELKGIMIVYNVFQIAYNTYIFHGVSHNFWQ